MSAEPRTSNGRRWPRKTPRPDRWSSFRWVIQHEAAYMMGAHPHLESRNLVWRSTVAGYSCLDCEKFLAYIERAWPARKIRP